MADTRGSPARATILAQPVASTSAAVVGMDADRRVEPRDAAGERDGVGRRRDVPAGHEEPLDPGRSGGCDDRVEIRREPVGLEVAVGVDQAHALSRRSVARRRRSPSGAEADAGSRRGDLELEPREERHRVGQPAGLAGVGAPGELLEQRWAAVAVRGVRVGVAELGQDPRCHRPA